MNILCLFCYLQAGDSVKYKYGDEYEMTGNFEYKIGGRG